jgi:zinc protease
LSIRELKKELEEIAEKRPATETELKETCKQEMLSLGGQWETMQGQLSALTDLVWFGFPDDFWSTYADRISKVSLDDAHKATRTLVHPDSLVWVIIGDRARVEAEVKEQLGKIQLINTEGVSL